MIIHLLFIALLASPMHEVSIRNQNTGATIAEEGIRTYHIFKLEEGLNNQYALSVITTHPTISTVPLVSRNSCNTFAQFNDLLKDLEKHFHVNLGTEDALSFVQFGKNCSSACDTSIDKAAIQDLSLGEMLAIKMKFPELRE